MLLSIDDYYFSKKKRIKLSKKIHPLLITRGVPGTHDIVALKNDIIKVYYSDKNRWTQIMRDSIKTGVDFTAHRMVIEYQNKYYMSEVKI